MTGQPIGYVTWGESIRAELLGRDSWKFTIGDEERPDLAGHLTILYLDHYQGPSDGEYGHRILRELASKVDGEMTWNLPPRAPHDGSD